MTTQQPAPAQRSQNGFGFGRALVLVCGSLLAVLGATLIVLGASAPWFMPQGGRAWVVTTTASTPTSALVSDAVTLHGMPHMTPTWIGSPRVSARSNPGAEVFIGIAREQDVAEYLSGTAYDRVTFDDRPGAGNHPRRVYQRVNGDLRSLDDPREQTFWVAAADGPGWQTVTWKPSDGRWVLLIANSDGSPALDVTARFGVGLATMDWIPRMSLWIGLTALAVGALLIGAGAYRPRR